MGEVQVEVLVAEEEGAGNMTDIVKKKISIPDPSMGPVRFSVASFKTAISGIGTIFKKPKILLTTLFISLVQVALSYLKILLPSSFLLSIASFFTFAQGGMYAGLLGAVGGVFGKGIYAWFINSLFISGSKNKVGNTENEKTEKNMKKKAGLFLAGVGVALIAYNFLTGNASLENSVIGITALAACLRAIKRKKGFLIGLICSFTKGEMSRNTAVSPIKGMVLGFLLGVISSLKFTGIICYIAGTIIFILALILLAGKRRTIAAVGALILILNSGLPALASLPTDGWMTPWEAYGISYREGSFDSHRELRDAMEASPPLSMELTLFAIGDSNYFEESGRINNQRVVVLDGKSETFTVNSPQTWYFSFTSYINLVLEDEGWYVDSKTDYSIKDSWTNNETEAGQYEDHQKIHALYGSNIPMEAGDFYIGIPIEFEYGDKTKVYSLSYLYARVDSVKREKSLGETPQNYDGSWQLKEVKSYFIESSRSSYRVAETHDFIDEFSGNDPTYDTIATISGNTIDYKIITDYPPATKNVRSFTAEFNGLPEQMEAFETLRVTAIGSGYYEDEINNESEIYDSVPITVGLLPGLRQDEFSTTESDTDTIVYPLGWGLGELWFEEINGAFQATAPQGQEEGELLTIELILGSNNPYDATASRHMGTPVIAYIYQWDMKGEVPAGTDGEDEDNDSDNGWWGGSDSDEEWSEHASEEDTLAIGAISAVAAIAGAGAAAAGGFGVGPGGGSYIKRNRDGDLVVRDPVTGEESLYVGNKKTGLFTNLLTGAEYTEDELVSHVASRAENADVLGQDYQRAQDAIKQHRKDNQELSQAESEVALEKRLKKLQKDLETKGAIGDDYADELAKKLNILRSQKKIDGEFNKDDLKKFQRTLNRWTQGEIAGSRGLPPAENDWDIYKKGLALSGEEIARGDSWKSIALRVAVGLLTGGQSTLGTAFVVEAGLELAQAGYTMKDYVDKGGDDWLEGAQLAVTKTLVGEGIGRSVGLGIKGLGLAASKTGQVLSKTNAGKYVVDGISNTLEKSSKVLNANVGDVPKVIKQISKEASESATAAKKAASMAGDLKASVGSKVAQDADDASKKVAQSADDAAKKAPQKSGDTATKPSSPKNIKDTDAYKEASNEVDDALRKYNEEAAKKIEKYRNDVNKNPDLSARKAAHEQGGKIGLEKVDKLEQARKALSGNPDSPQLQKEFEAAVKDVQINKHAQKIMNEKKLTTNDTRQGFNDFKVKKDAVVSLNTSERLAVELGLDPKSVSNVQATNSMDTSGVGDIKGVAVKSDFKTPKTTEAKKFTEADIDLNSLEKKGGEKISIDLDQTYRMEIKMKDGSIIAKDIPADKVRRIQNEEVYKVWNDGNLPLKADGSIDHEAVKKFADDMDYTVVDARSADAYGTIGDLQQALKSDGSIRQYKDPEVVSKAISYKSDEWLERGSKKMVDGNFIGAEGDIAEGIRQSTKQFDSQYVYQVKAINAAAGKTKIVVNEKLAEGMQVLKQIGYGEGKLSPAEAEAILNEMGTNSEDVMKLLADEVEIINRLLPGGKK